MNPTGTMATIDTQFLRSQLFDQSDRQPYVILDGASVPELRQRLWQHTPAYLCLYPGELDDEMAQVAPYLVKLASVSDFTDFVLEGWGQHWGVFLLSSADLRDLRRHFRKFIMVHHPDTGRPMYFRFYDPRVLRVFLPSCDAAQLAELFGPISRYLMEDEDPGQLLIARQDAGQLGSERLTPT